MQLVADALHHRGECTFRQLMAYLKSKIPPEHGYPNRNSEHLASIEPSSVKASLLVLLQHSIVSYTADHRYQIHLRRATWIPRYAKYLEYLKRTYNDDAAVLWAAQTLLLQGRVRTVDWVLWTLEYDIPKSDRYTSRHVVIEALWKLVTGGFVEEAPTIPVHEGEDEAEFEKEFPPKKKVRLSVEEADSDEDPGVLSVLQSNSHYGTILPVNSVWRINFAFLHQRMRAFALGRMVGDLYNHRVQFGGSLVTAALRYMAHTKAESFAPQETIKFVPKPVLQALEKRNGGVAVHLPKAWHDLSRLIHPVVVAQRFSADQFQVCIRELRTYLQERIRHQLVSDHVHPVAARIISILRTDGWMDADMMAERVMVPAKDTREFLHELYRQSYIDVFPINGTGRHHNPAQTHYIWKVDTKRLEQKIRESVSHAIWHLRIRRQHQMQVKGKQWIERAQNAGDFDENEDQTDKLNYDKFCLGLERLECSLLHLDDTAMALLDF